MSNKVTRVLFDQYDSNHGEFTLNTESGTIHVVWRDGYLTTFDYNNLTERPLRSTDHEAASTAQASDNS
jgi:hypothetical protein